MNSKSKYSYTLKLVLFGQEPADNQQLADNLKNTIDLDESNKAQQMCLGFNIICRDFTLQNNKKIKIHFWELSQISQSMQLLTHNIFKGSSGIIILIKKRQETQEIINQLNQIFKIINQYKTMNQPVLIIINSKGYQQQQQQDDKANQEVIKQVQSQFPDFILTEMDLSNKQQFIQQMQLFCEQCLQFLIANKDTDNISKYGILETNQAKSCLCFSYH